MPFFFDAAILSRIRSPVSDWHQALNYQRQITDIDWYFDNYGPYVPDVIRKAQEFPNIFSCESTNNMYGKSKTLVRLIDPSYLPQLADSEKESADHIIDITKTLNWNDFIQLIYSTYPITSSTRYSTLNLVDKAAEYQSI
jgi:hypothetical protein